MSQVMKLPGAARPDIEDASLLVQLAQWYTAAGMPAALAWLWSEGFVPDYGDFLAAYPPGSSEDSRLAQLCAYFDTIGTLDRHGLLHQELVLDWLSVGPVWDRVKSYVYGTRRRTAIPTLWANFESLATAHKRLTRQYST